MERRLIRLIPKPIRQKIYALAINIITQHRKLISNQLPKFELNKDHIANLKVLLNREELLKILPKKGVVAELGVDQGAFSEQILNICTPKKLHLVDFWGSQRYNQEKRKGLEEKFTKQIADELVEVNLGLSTDVAETFEDNYFDWVYIDTDHSYKTTIAELESYRGKMKDNGIIAGHDYIIGNWDGMVRYGVIEAVYEFCVKYNWEMLYITMENQDHPSFAIRKISTATVKS